MTKIPTGTEIRGIRKFITVSPTLDTSGAHTSGDVVATVTLSGAAREVGWTGKVKSITAIDLDNQKLTLDFYFFSDTITTAQVQNVAVNISAADAANYLGQAKILNTDYEVISSSRAAFRKADLSIPVKPISTVADIYCVIVTRGAPTYTANGMKFIFEIEED